MQIPIFGSSREVSIVADSLARIPPATRSRLADAGLTIHIVSGGQVPGGGEGVTTSGRGVLRITLAAGAPRLAHTTLHEVGHAFDFVIGRPSEKEAWQQIYHESYRKFGFYFSHMMLKDPGELFACCCANLWADATEYRWLPAYQFIEPL